MAVAVVVAALVTGVLGVRATTEDPAPGGASVPGGTAHGSAVAAAPAGPAAKSVAVRPVLARPPSIVLVLMDDFSLDLLDTMRSAERMRRTGATYEHAFVVDSLCCVSRSSLLTGQYPHQTGVLTNTANTPNPYGPVGGWEAYAAYGNEQRSFPLRLQQRGYTTGFVGKFLNQYEMSGGVAPPVPPGWDDWRVLFGAAYSGWGFASTRLEDGVVRVEDHPQPPAGASDAEKDAAYAGTVTGDLALDFIRAHRDDDAPYFLEVAPYAPHSRTDPWPAYPGDPLFPPAFRDRPRPGSPDGDCGRVRCDRLGADRLVGLGDDQSDNAPRYADGRPAPAWNPATAVIAPADAATSLRNRARMVQSIDRTVRRILREVGPDTYVVLTSDNGFHLGQHGLGKGKGAPYDSDVHVPLLVTGPGVVPGTRAEVVSNIDLAPTFEDLAGLLAPAYRSGTSLVPTFGDAGLDRRGYTFLEHTWAPSLGFDPDRPYSGGTIDLIPSYVAVRSRHSLLVRLDLDPSWDGTDFAWEYYDYRDAAYERTNTFADPSHPDDLARLRRRLERFVACRAATRDTPVPPACRTLTRLAR
jgi:arylsulfatase A-like enzyme